MAISLSSGLPAPSTLPTGLAEIPMQGDFNAPLKVQAPATVDVLGETSRAYKLSDQMMQHREKQEEEQDRLQVNDYVKQGGNFSTPEGINKAAQDLRGKVSAKSYQELVTQAQQSATWQTKMNEAYAKLPEQQFKQTEAQNELVLQQLERASMAYDEAAKTKGEPAAIEDFNAAKKAAIAYVSNLKTPDGKPMLGEDFISSYSEMSPAMVKSMLETSKFHQARLRDASTIRLNNAKAQQIEQGGPEVARLAALEEEFGKDSPEYKAALLKMQGKGGAGGAGGKGNMNPDAIDIAAERLLVGDTTALTNIGRGAQGAADIAAINNRVATLAKERFANPQEAAQRIMQARAELRSASKGLDTLASRSAKIDSAALEVDKFADNALSALDKVSRGDIVPVNSILRKVATGSGSPEEVAFATYVQSLSGAYASVISRGNPTVNSQREAADIIGKDMSKPQFRAMIAALKNEAKAVQQSSTEAAKNIKAEAFNPQGSEPGKNATPATAPAPTPGGGGPVKINSPEELKKAVSEGRLKIGGHFVGPDGVDRVLKKEPK